MPNALEVKGLPPKKILLLGDTGNGKTTQFLTLPGKKYAYLFDPNALNSLRGYDVDYDEYLPTPVPAAVASLSKSTPGDKRSSTSSVYKLFESQFNERTQSGFFDKYDWVGFDSATTLLDLMMDRVLDINGRLGQWPHEDDWGPQMIAFTNLVRTLTAMNKNIFMTGHMQDKKNRKTGASKRQPMMTGQLATKIPLLFSEIFGCDVDVDNNGKIAYLLHTVPDGEFTVIRTSIKGLNPTENVTIKFFEAYEDEVKGHHRIGDLNLSKPVSPVGQGIGGILNWERKQLKVAA